PLLALSSTMRPSSKRAWMFSISVPLWLSGLVAETVPSTRRRWGVVNTSSVGILGLQVTPFLPSEAPPFHLCPSARPMVRSVPGPLYLRAENFLPLSQVLRALRLALWAFQAAIGSSWSTRLALKMASASLAMATSSGSLGKTSLAQLGVG